MKVKFTTILNLFLVTMSCCCFDSFAQTTAKNEAVEVPFDFNRNVVIVQVKVNGKGFYNMMLDTGANPSVVDLRTAKEMGLKLASTGHQGSGVGTDVNLSYETKLPDVEIGGLTAKNVKALAIDLSKLTNSLARPVHGVLGHSFLNNRIVQIDYPKRVVRFYAKSPFPKNANQSKNAKLATLAFRYRDDILIDEVSVNGKSMIARFDTGSNSSFQLTPAAVAGLGLEAEVGKAQVSQSAGFNGVAENRKGRVSNITLGGISVDGPTVIFYGKGTGNDEQPWGINIGNAFLKDFVVTIDYRSKVISLEKP